MPFLTDEKRKNIENSIKQSNAIFKLEGFEETEQTRLIDNAVLAGKVSPSQVVKEMIEYVKQHKTTDGFIESRSWHSNEIK